MLRYLREFERLHGRTATQFEAARWRRVLSGQHHDDVEDACAMWIEEWVTVDLWPSPDDILGVIDALHGSGVQGGGREHVGARCRSAK